MIIVGSRHKKHIDAFYAMHKPSPTDRYGQIYYLVNFGEYTVDWKVKDIKNIQDKNEMISSLIKIIDEPHFVRFIQSSWF